MTTPTAPVQSITQRLANPTRFMELSGGILPWLTCAALLVIVWGLAAGFSAPPDYQQKHTVKIMFIHVPSAWIAMMAYGLVAVSSFGLLVWRHPLADVSAKAAVPIGAVFTLLALVTGSLWGKPMWGTYWQWDARMTSVLILLFLYLGLMALRASLDDEVLASKLTAVLALVGIVILPVIKYSVDWWNTLHQPSGIFKGSIDPVFLQPLLICAIGFTLLFFALHMKSMRNEILRRRLKSRRQIEVERASRTEILKGTA